MEFQRVLGLIPSGTTYLRLQGAVCCSISAINGKKPSIKKENAHTQMLNVNNGTHFAALLQCIVAKSVK